MEKDREKVEQDYLGLQEIADRLGVSWNFVRDRIVPNVTHIRIHNRILVNRKAFEAYLDNLEREA